ncbi:MAG: glycoside hydrolase family 18 protein [Dictyoglomus sp.]|nr:glycoside hydrolase family 18 protein [Dictyoglomus sp.]MCX7941543.1 glycoside hydrolase family 18 protein [Dictyoglomaceae bacterium]MDW8187837.1 glycoside hydrolase family 18 protein [Dictyoglomus sp.]
MKNKRIVGYYPEWAVKNKYLSYLIEDIPWHLITHLNYAFAKVENGEISVVDKEIFWENIKSLKIYKEKFSVKVLISVGGWTLSGEFSDVAFSSENREIFAKSCIDFIREYNFDGIDIDWEFPVEGGLPTNKYRPEDKENFTLLLKTLRLYLNKAGIEDNRDYILSIAAPAGFREIENTEPNKYHFYLDYINLMTYDFHGSWDKITNHLAPLYGNPMDPDPVSREKLNCDYAVNKYLELGVPKEKINLGIPFYGRGWITEDEGINGLFAKVSGLPCGIFDDEDKPSGGNPFFFIKGVLENDKGFIKFRDEYSKVPWIWNPEKKIMYSYDDEESIKEKCDYVIRKGLGGIMFWEFTGDYPLKGYTLTSIIFEKMRGG